MNKRQKQHKSIMSGNANGVMVIDKDLGFALRTFKRKMKQSNVLENLKENKRFIKSSVKRRRQINKAKYIQQIKDLQQFN